LGSSEFVERVLKEDELQLDAKSKWKEEGWDLQRLSVQVCLYVDIDQLDLRRKGRLNKISEAKGLICYWASDVLGVSTTAIGKFLGIARY